VAGFEAPRDSTGADDWHEWLWDLCWARMNIGAKGWQGFHGLWLACEIEWSQNKNAVFGDFLKLTVAKADYRLFIFSKSKRYPH